MLEWDSHPRSNSLHRRAIGDGVAILRGKANSLGYAELQTLDIRNLGLDVISDEKPLHHANITAWSSDDDKTERKRLQLVKAKQLVEVSCMKIF